MCLYPRLIRNRKYVANEKNKGNVPIPNDRRVLQVPVGCGKCIECKNQKSRSWNIRLQEEIKNHKQGYKHFITFTFSTDSLIKLRNEITGLKGYELDNEICTRATRYFLERWRKKYKQSIKHWFVTELGSGKTEHVHIHGIIFLNVYKHKNLIGIALQYKLEQIKDIREKWGYGFVYVGDYVNESTVQYIVKYMTKTDLMHPNYNSKVLCSKGIGASYVKTAAAELNRQGQDYYKASNGKEINLPTYYRTKLYNDETRETLWLKLLDKEERYVLGSRISVKNDYSKYWEAVKHARQKNKRLGYGNDEKDWSKIQYENELREIKFAERLGREK